MIDYSVFYRRSIAPERIAKEVPAFDVFVSAFNPSGRVQRVFADVVARRKIWILHPEYGYNAMEEPKGYEIVRPTQLDEVSQVNQLLAAVGNLRGQSLCVDVTGFMRHVLVFLIAKLASMGLESVDVVYSEPISYSKAEETVFSTTTSGVVRTVRGMSASGLQHGKDHLIVGVGFDAKLISLVAHYKDDAVIHPIFAFPSLSADMYQQSAMKAAQSGEVALQGEWIDNRVFAPANDPFSTAEVVRDLVKDVDRRDVSASIYLAPLSTKVQALGFAIYWWLEGRARGGVSLLLPECLTYSRETSSGLRRLWLYTIEFT